MKTLRVLNKEQVIIFLMIAIFFLSGTNAAFSQRQIRQVRTSVVRPEVVSIDKHAITLTKGGAEAIIVVDGKNLDRVQRAQLFRGTLGLRNRYGAHSRIPRGKIEATIVNATATQLTLSLKATQAADIASDYYIQLQDARQNRLANIINYTQGKGIPPNLLKISVARGAVAASRTPAAQARQPVTAGRQPAPPPRQPTTPPQPPPTTPKKPVTAGRQPATVGRQPVSAGRQPAQTGARLTPQPPGKIGTTPLTGNMRFTPLTQWNRNSGEMIPPNMNGKNSIQGVQWKRFTLKSQLLKVERRAPVSFQSFNVVATPQQIQTRQLGDKKLPTDTETLPNGETVTYAEWEAEANRIQKQFNDMGYSLKDQPGKSVVLAKVEKVINAENPRPGIRAKRTDPFRTPQSITSDFQRRMSPSSGRSGMTTSPAQRQPGTVQSGVRQPQRLQPSRPQPTQPAVPSGPATKYDPPRIVPEPIIKGETDIFAAYMDGWMKLYGDENLLRIRNHAEFGIWIFSHKIPVAGVELFSKSPKSDGNMECNFSGLLFGNPIPLNNLTHPSEISTGWKSYGVPVFDYGYQTTMMIGPIPIELRIGASIAAGINYSAGTNSDFNGNYFVPWIVADAYAQAGVNLIIVSAGARCRVTIFDAYYRMLGLMERRGNSLIGEYFVDRDWEACSGRIEAYVNVYIPFIVDKEWTATLFSWTGWRGSGYSVVPTNINHAIHE